jgi:hypothetical protein
MADHAACCPGLQHGGSMGTELLWYLDWAYHLLVGLRYSLLVVARVELRAFVMACIESCFFAAEAACIQGGFSVRLLISGEHQQYLS